MAARARRQVYTMAIDTVMLSFCEDCEAHGGEPRSAPPLLLHALHTAAAAEEERAAHRPGPPPCAGGAVILTFPFPIQPAPPSPRDIGLAPGCRAAGWQGGAGARRPPAHPVQGRTAGRVRAGGAGGAAWRPWRCRAASARPGSAGRCPACLSPAHPSSARARACRQPGRSARLPPRPLAGAVDRAGRLDPRAGARAGRACLAHHTPSSCSGYGSGACASEQASGPRAVLHVTGVRRYSHCRKTDSQSVPGWAPCAAYPAAHSHAQVRARAHSAERPRAHTGNRS